MSKNNLTRYAAECFGTFFLVFMGTGSVILNQISGGNVTQAGIGIVFGCAVIAMIYSIGKASGSHINPAVTIGLYTAGKFEGKYVLPYIFSQILGAVLASLCLSLIFRASLHTLGITLPSGSPAQSFFLEWLMTFILMIPILRMKSRYAGLVIGTIVGLEAFWGGPISGASMNPARSFGPALVSGNFNHHWIYWCAPISAAVTASKIFLQSAQVRENLPQN